MKKAVVALFVPAMLLFVCKKGSSDGGISIVLKNNSPCFYLKNAAKTAETHSEYFF